MKRILFLGLIVFIFGSGYAQQLWNPVSERSLENITKAERASIPSKKQLFSLDLEAMKAALAGAPDRAAFSAPSTVIIPLPDGDGTINHFRVYEASFMHPDLAAQHPGIKSYVGQGIEDPSLSVRFSVTLFGLHSIMFAPGGTSYIDTYTTDLANYIAYKKSDLKGPRNFGCRVINEPAGEAAPKNLPKSALTSDGILRTYRLAMACTVEYASFHVNAAGLNSGTTAQKKAAVLAAMNVTMTRVNGIYEKDLAITMQLVPNNENVIFVTSDNLDNNNADVLISQIQNVINAGIGTSNYDIGHVVSTGAGGLANLACVCTSNKARGVTGSPAPVGDAYDVDYVAHEMGHQFGASHTFNNSFQRNASTAVEPGSGSTIMAYAGISPPNVQNNSDDYFHTVSISEIVDFIDGTGGSCAVETANGNSPPVIANIPNYSIPKSTAFVLRGNATDANGDALTYCWEQTNANGASFTQNNTPSPTATSGPNYRSLSPSTSPNRYMPELSSVLAGNLTPTWEVTPSVGRNLSFALTVRDNRVPNGGQTARENITVNVNNVAGPFMVTSQTDEGITWNEGSQQTITWDVAGTTANGVNTNNVNILLSTDGGQTFDVVLASNTPNDGSEMINVPNVSAPFCRIMVEGAGNIFYAVNSTPFAIGVEVITVCNDFENNTPVAIPDGAAQYSVAQVEVTDEGLVQTIELNVNITHTYIGDVFLALQSPSGTAIQIYEGSCSSNDDLIATFSDEGSAVNCTTPVTGIILPAEALSAFAGEEAQGTWTLYYGDAVADDSGTLNSWSVDVCTQGVASAETHSLNDFRVFPNPGNGVFTVEFTSTSTDEIGVEVYDMRGRSVYRNQYDNTGLISAPVNLQGLQQGVYLVTVQDGNTKAMKKVIIE